MAESTMSSSLAAILLYCACSMCMIYANKTVLSVMGFHFPSVLLLVQSLFAVGCLQTLSRTTSVVKLPDFKTSTAIKWLPVTVLFSLMLYSGSQTVRYLSIPILTVFKNLTNLLIAYGDWHLFGQRVSGGIFGSFVLMLLGSILSGYTDLEFNLTGYMWMAFNCCSQACYVLYMRKAKRDTKLNEWGMSYYNNLLSAGIMVVTCVVSGELTDSLEFERWHDTTFLSVLCLSGVVGTALSMSVFWVVSVTSPTTYSMIGATNKIPITLVSVFLFHTTVDAKGAFSLGIGLVSGVVYALTKLQMQKESYGASPASRHPRKLSKPEEV